MSNQKKLFSGNLWEVYDKARLFLFDLPRPPVAPTPIVPMMPPSLPTPLTHLPSEYLEELKLLLKPIAAEPPCGPALRFDPVFTEIRLAREEDDPSLPMGQWERPLKRADWPLIESRCKAMLTSRSKDLQLAAWLLEAWTRQHAFAGLYRGLGLIDRLLRRFWEPLHPMIEDDDDCDARIAPLEWLNESLAATLKVQVALLNFSGRKPPKLTFADWERMTAKELAAQGHVPEAKPGDVVEAYTREEIIAYARQHMAPDVEGEIDFVRQCIVQLGSMQTFVDEKLGAQAPNLSKLHGTLDAIERVLTQLLPERKEEDMTLETPQGLDFTPEAQDATPVAGAPAGAAPAAQVPLSGWKNRHEAYATLGAIADYLSLVEPHSPTPYLLRRAVNWGRMPLPELMAEIIREEGDLNRLMNVLGLKE
ncbi:MAG TPA: type VI secretion system protein TssA [Janthinobacterium sp.]|nr:type VI secretion system protein TssA [Janthinobacterium sp.]